jgi:hypothetical protein
MDLRVTLIWFAIRTMNDISWTVLEVLRMLATTVHLGQIFCSDAKTVSPNGAFLPSVYIDRKSRTLHQPALACTVVQCIRRRNLIQGQWRRASSPRVSPENRFRPAPVARRTPVRFPRPAD